MEDFILELLRNAKSNTQILSIYTVPKEPSRFWAGYVLKIDESFVLIAHITPYGKYDGYIVQPIDSIWKVEEQSQYNMMLEKLYCLQNQKHEAIFKEDGIVKTILRYAIDNHLVITLSTTEDYEEDVVGYVKDFNECYAKILSLNQYGQADGIIVVALEKILLISCDTDKEIALRLLSSANQTEA